MSSQNSSQHGEEGVEHGDTARGLVHTEAFDSSTQNEDELEKFSGLIGKTDASLTPGLQRDETNDGDQINSDNYTTNHVEAKDSLSKEEGDADAQTETAETSDNVGHEVRQYVPGELEPPLANDYDALEDVQAASPQRNASDDMKYSEHGSHSAAMFGFALQNPSQGVQAENVSPPEADNLEDKDTTENKRKNADMITNAKSPGGTDTPKSSGLSLQSLSVLRSLSTTMSVSDRGLVEITLTFLPMGFRTRLVQPVYNINAFSSEGIEVLSEYNEFRSIDNEEREWVLIARDLIEAIARHICLHPQAFVVYHQDKRIRFNSLMFLESERGRSAGQGGRSAGLSGRVEDAATMVRTEPLWLSIVFSEAGRILTKNVVNSEDFLFPDEQLVAEEEPVLYANQLQAASSLANVPRHLVDIQRDEFLAKCILVRKERIVIDPHVLVEGRRQGFTFDEIIQSIHKHERGVAGNEAVMTAVSIVQAPTAPPKPFLGGYRVRQDPRRVLLHATTQIFMTDLDYSPHGGKKRAQFILDTLRSRQTQTYGKSRSTQTRREGCAQTARPDMLLDNTHDVLVAARPYFSADALLKLRIEKVIILQKMYRQWKSRQICRELYAVEAERQMKTAARQRVEEAAVRARADLEKLRRMNPHRANDFGVLKEELLLWRVNKEKTIKQDESLSAEQKREALLSLTKEEVKLLQDLELHRQAVQQDQQGQRLVRVLEKAAAAKIWGGIDVTTPGTVRAAELRDLFYSLTNDDFDASSRMDVLLHIKWTVKEFPDSSETKELCQLIDREADLINRGWKSASLVELRKRITNIFRRFILDPEYNPEMVRYNDSSLARRKIETLSRDKLASGQ